jgi:hypothetical protein
VSPGISGRLINTTAFVKLVKVVEIETQDWSPTSVYPPSNHGLCNNEFEIISMTSLLSFVRTWQKVGATDGMKVGVRDGEKGVAVGFDEGV